MIKRRKLNILMALAMAMTLMFGSTVCFAAETDDVAEAVEQETKEETKTETKEDENFFVRIWNSIVDFFKGLFD